MKKTTDAMASVMDMHRQHWQHAAMHPVRVVAITMGAASESEIWSVNEGLEVLCQLLARRRGREEI